VIDLDVHQGNGTAKIFANDDSVFTFSMHGAKNFPLRKEQSDLDVPLDDGTGDDDYLALLERHLPTLWDRARPDVVIYLQGVDPHEHDKFGRMKLTDEGLYRRDRRVLSEVQRRGSPVLMLLAGGYAVPPNAPRNQRLTSPDLTANLHAMQHRAARDLGMIRTAQPGQAHV
jgi:acetoin utilization deacetylase AcuC-like enzyme